MQSTGSIRPHGSTESMQLIGSVGTQYNWHDCLDSLDPIGQYNQCDCMDPLNSYNQPNHIVDGTLFILVGPPRDCRNIVVQILISVEVRLFQ